MRNVIDFFAMNVPEDLGDELLRLAPRYMAEYGGRRERQVKRAEQLRAVGIVPVTNMMWTRTREAARGHAALFARHGIGIVQLWSEPNRTFTDKRGGGDNWLSTVTWNEFCEHAGMLYQELVAADSTIRISGPVLTSDEFNDPRWLAHLVEFVLYFVDRGYELHYLTINIPYDPSHVDILSQVARGIAAEYRQLNLQGIAVGEYPFFVDSPARHVGFFKAFENAWRLAYAAKSHFRASFSNSGIVTTEGKRTPTYYLFERYAAMRGVQVRARDAGGGTLVCLAAADTTSDTLRCIVGNDHRTGRSVAVVFHDLNGPVVIRDEGFTARGMKEISSGTLKPDSTGALVYGLGEIGAAEARSLTVSTNAPLFFRRLNTQDPRGSGKGGSEK